MLRVAALFAAMSGFFFANVLHAVTSDFPVRGPERILITVPEAVVNVQATNSRSLRISLSEGATTDYNVHLVGNVIRIEPKDLIQRESFGKPAAKKRLIEIQGPSVPLEIHTFEGQVQLKAWAREALLHVQKGRIVAREGAGTLIAHSENGEILIVDHQGRVIADSYKAALKIQNLNGDADLENFAGETWIDKSRGAIALDQGQGSSKILSSAGNLQFDLTKGSMSIQNFEGRVEGQTSDGAVSVNLASESDLNVKAGSGKVSVQAPAESGALLNLSSVDGDITVPNYLKVNRDSGQKTLRGRLKGDSQKGSIVVRSQAGSIVIR